MSAAVFLIRPEYRDRVSAILAERAVIFEVGDGRPPNPPGTLAFKVRSVPGDGLWDLFNSIPPAAHAVTLASASPDPPAP